jgi:hypothetical protein
VSDDRITVAANSNDFEAEASALARVLSALQSLSDASRQRVLRSATAFFDVRGGSGGGSSSAGVAEQVSVSLGGFSEDRTLTPKEFLLQKRPTRDIDRIACLAYYLTHFRDMPKFKTLDLSKLNTEAAQIKFSNAAKAVDNSAAAGLLVAAGGGLKQLSAVGELYVQALPDRDAAKAAIEQVRPRRRKSRSRSISEAESE